MQVRREGAWRNRSDLRSGSQSSQKEKEKEKQLALAEKLQEGRQPA